MNKIKTMVIGFLILFGATVWGQDVSKTKAEHIAWASKYKELAKEQQLIIDDHVKMRKDYYKKYWINEKVSSKQKIKEMENHCDKIIENAKTQKTNFDMMAEMHSSFAKELDGK